MQEQEFRPVPEKPEWIVDLNRDEFVAFRLLLARVNGPLRMRIPTLIVALGCCLLMVGLALIGMHCAKRKTLAVAPVVFSGGMVFIMMMVVGLGGICASLSILAAKMKKKGTIALFVLSFVCAMGMGHMSSKDSSLAWVNWVEQSINTVSQLCLMLGVITLHKAGLAAYQPEAKA